MDCIIFDVETTGLSPNTGHRIIEIGAVALQGADMVSEFHSLIDSGHPVSRQAQQVHGISRRMLRGAPPPLEVFTAFREFIGHTPFQVFAGAILGIFIAWLWLTISGG